jgi:hypothetical protein
MRSFLKRRRRPRAEAAGARHHPSEIAAGHPVPQNAAAADSDGRKQTQSPSELPDGLEIEETDAQEAGGDDDAANASDVQAAIADLHVDGVLRERNEDDE